jgi:hypothetical protein
MTPEQQRIAIAEACGWTEIEPCTCCNGVSRAYEPTPGAHKKHLPNYPFDLNAMHEAEKIIPRQLFHVDYWQKGYGRFQQILSGITITPYSATATQRAEAFLRTIGKWEEAK